MCGQGASAVWALLRRRLRPPCPASPTVPAGDRRQRPRTREDVRPRPRRAPRARRRRHRRARGRAHRGRRALGDREVDAPPPPRRARPPRGGDHPRRRPTGRRPPPARAPGGPARPEAGTIAVDGERIDGRPERELTSVRRRKVGFVFQFFHLIPELTGEENVLLPARLPGTRNGALHRGRALIAQLGLEDAAQRLPHELSGGEPPRPAGPRALAPAPPLVLADEPTGNLDVEAGAAVLGLLRTAASDGRAVVLVTHDEAATAQADRVLRLRDGRLEG